MKNIYFRPSFNDYVLVTKDKKLLMLSEMNVLRRIHLDCNGEGPVMENRVRTLIRIQDEAWIDGAYPKDTPVKDQDGKILPTGKTGRFPTSRGFCLIY